jgi:hypothetical protein
MAETTSLETVLTITVQRVHSPYPYSPAFHVVVDVSMAGIGQVSVPAIISRDGEFEALYHSCAEDRYPWAFELGCVVLERFNEKRPVIVEAEEFTDA